MSVIFYSNVAEYIESAASTKERILRIYAIIEALESAALKAAGTANLEDYNFDDGQSKISATYRSPKAISDAIDAYQKILIRLQSKLTGRTTIARDINSAFARKKY